MAPLWDFSKGQFVGMLSALDFILILREVCTCKIKISFLDGSPMCKYFLYFSYILVKLACIGSQVANVLRDIDGATNKLPINIYRNFFHMII